MDTDVYVHRIRVRPSESDRMGVVHHSRYAVYLEEARTELLRRAGLSYRQIENAGAFLVVTDLVMKFARPVRAFDEVEIECRITSASYVTISHEYAVRVAGQAGPAVTASTRLACVGADGRPRRLPDEILSVVGVT